MLHAGLVIIVPDVVPAVQQALVADVLEYVGDRGLTNRTVEINLERVPGAAPTTWVSSPCSKIVHAGYDYARVPDLVQQSVSGTQLF